MDTLQGNFLIATPQMPDPRFQEQVVYLCSHTPNGAMGLVINRPSEHSLAEVLEGANLPLPPGPLPMVYLGGPVETKLAFFLHSAEYQAEEPLRITSSVCISQGPRFLYDLALGQGPKDYLVAVGYSGWGPGQLENELKHYGWLTLPGDDEILFRTPDSLKWRRAASRYGIDIATFNDAIGNA